MSGAASRNSHPDSRSDDRHASLLPKLVLLLASTSLGLAAALAWPLTRHGSSAFVGMDAQAWRERSRELVKAAGGVWDSHPDPDVGRVLMPDLDGRSDQGVAVHSNHFGVREAAYQLPKPDHVLRVVLLGDSMVFGYKMPEEQRVGVYLAGLLAPWAKQVGKTVECLHVGFSAWNLRAECAFLRRQLSLLQPDVVLHLTVGNDLDDNPSVRGFGAMADFTDRWRGHCDGTITDTHPRFLGAGPTSISPLKAALDFEGRSRFEAAASDVAKLRDAVVAVGGRYILIVLDPVHWPASLDYFGDVLAKEEIAFLPAFEAGMRLAADDLHWNSRGMSHFAKYCYELLRARGGLVGLELPASPSDDELFSTLNSRAEKEARESKARLDFEAQIGPRISFTFDGSHDAELRQVYGGILQPGVVLPYASMILRNDAAKELVVDGEFLDRPELRGGGVDIFVEEIRVGRLELGADRTTSGGGFSRQFALPDTVRSRKFVSVRFVGDDWALEGHELRRCVCFCIRSVALRYSLEKRASRRGDDDAERTRTATRRRTRSP